LPPDQLAGLIQSYIRESVALREQITDIALYMEGGVDWNSLWGASFEDREIMIRAINRRLKAQNPNAKEYM
jgi:hypothetical protein